MWIKLVWPFMLHGDAANGREKPKRFGAVRLWQRPYSFTSASDLIYLGGFIPLLSPSCKYCYLKTAEQ